MSKDFWQLVVRLTIAAHRLHNDPSNPKRLVTLNNLIERIEEYNEPV